MKKYYVLIIFSLVFWQGVLTICFSASNVESPFARPQVEYKASSLRDPFKSEIPRKVEVVTGTNTAQPVLPPEVLIKRDVQGLIWGGNFPQAIINNKVYKVGDDIGGAQIKAIAKDGVVLSFSGGELKLPAPKKAAK